MIIFVFIIIKFQNPQVAKEELESNPTTKQKHLQSRTLKQSELQVINLFSFYKIIFIKQVKISNRITKICN